jgi:hypothetical protein
VEVEVEQPRTGAWERVAGVAVHSDEVEGGGRRRAPDQLRSERDFPGSDTSADESIRIEVAS